MQDFRRGAGMLRIAEAWQGVMPLHAAVTLRDGVLLYIAAAQWDMILPCAVVTLRMVIPLCATGCAAGCEGLDSLDGKSLKMIQGSDGSTFWHHALRMI